MHIGYIFTFPDSANGFRVNMIFALPIAYLDTLPSYCMPTIEQDLPIDRLALRYRQWGYGSEQYSMHCFQTKLAPFSYRSRSVFKKYYEKQLPYELSVPQSFYRRVFRTQQRIEVFTTTKLFTIPNQIMFTFLPIPQ